MIATSRAIRYLHEPFNPDAFDPRICEARFERQFTYVCCENADPYLNGLARCLRPDAEFPRGTDASGASGSALRRALGLGRFARGWLGDKRRLMKDPHSVFAADWLAATFGMDVVVLIRHPAAFVGSVKQGRWSFRFEQLLEQPLLIQHHLGPFEREIAAHAAEERDFVDQGILLWNMIYHVISKYRVDHPGWIFLRHEDLSRDPVPAFRDVFRRLGLDYSAAVQKAIADFSGPNNPSEQHGGSVIRRDSRANIRNWERRLTCAEIARVRERTAEVAAHFYGERDW